MSLFEFFLIFIVITILNIPGLPLVLCAPGLFGLPLAWVVSYSASLISTQIHFLIVARMASNEIVMEKKNEEKTASFLDSAVNKVKHRPILTIAALRTIMFLTPPLTVALALAKIKPMEHFLGGVLGFVIPVTFYVVFFNAALEAVQGYGQVGEGVSLEL